MNKFQKLLETVYIGRVPLKNRIAMAPIGITGYWDPARTFARNGIDGKFIAG